jgi:hypothetical protein
LGEALDRVRKSEYGRLVGKDRGFIKGQKYTLLSRRQNLTLKGRQALKTLLSANKRLNTAYVLKESFGQLWSYEREGWARRFFENWKASLKWQRLRPYEKFAQMIEKHYRRLQQTGKQSLSGVRRRIEQQDSCHPETSLRTERRRVSAAQDSHFYVAGAVKTSHFYPLESTKSQQFIAFLV